MTVMMNTRWFKGGGLKISRPSMCAYQTILNMLRIGVISTNWLELRTFGRAIHILGVFIFFFISLFELLGRRALSWHQRVSFLLTFGLIRRSYRHCILKSASTTSW